MSIRMSGVQFREMMNSDDWEEDSYWEEVEIRIDGIEVPEDTDWSDLVTPNCQVTLIGGYYISNQRDLQAAPLDFEVFAKRWLDKQTHTSVMLTFPKSQESDVRAILQEHLPSVGVS